MSDPKDVKKRRKFRPGTKAIRTIAKLQKSDNSVFAHARFQGALKSRLSIHGLRVSPAAIEVAKSFIEMKSQRLVSKCAITMATNKKVRLTDRILKSTKAILD